MTNVRRSVLPVLAVVAVSCGSAHGSHDAPACAWRSIALPRIDGDFYLNAVAAIRPSDVWGGGRENPGYPIPSQPLLLHWSGRRLTRVRLRDPDTDLRAVSATTSNDVWAVGSNNRVGGTVTLHWNGSLWKHVRSPNDPRSRNNQFEDVVAISKTEALAVGFVYNSNRGENWPLIEKWNGHSWRIAPTPIQ